MWKLINSGTHLLMPQMNRATMTKVKVFEISSKMRRTFFLLLYFILLGFLDENNHTVRDTPLAYQMYKHIESSKDIGVSEAEAITYFGQSKLNGRSMIRSFVRTKIVDFYTTNQGRQTLRR